MNWDDAVTINAAFAERAKSRRLALSKVANDLLVEARDLVTVDPELAVQIIGFAQEVMQLASRIPVYRDKKANEE